MSPGAFANLPPPHFANGGKYPYPPGLLGFPGFLGGGQHQHPYAMDRRSTSKSPTSEPAQSPPTREDETLLGANGGGGGGIWHPLSSIKMENNQNEHKLEHETGHELDEGEEVDADGEPEAEDEESEK